MKSVGLANTFGLKKWITPVIKQSFVTAGVSLNLLAMGLILGFTVSLLDQLEVPESEISIGDEEGSWLASLPGFFAFGGTILVIPLMNKYGRRTANLISIFLLLISWIGIIFASNIAILLTARALQGINMGMATTLGPLLVGEYTSPTNRGAFLMTLSLCVAIGVFFSHIAAAFLTWRIGALVCSVAALINFIIVFISPESPSWLASQGKYEECKKAFRWLRGENEEEELDKIIATCIITKNFQANANESKLNWLKGKLNNFNVILRKKEFYKPLIIVAHLYTISVWCSAKIFISFPYEYIDRLCGHDVNAPLISTTFDLQRIFSSTLATYLIKKMKRRFLLAVTATLNIAALVTIAVYSYVREHYTLPFDHPFIGVVLSHILVITIATGSLPLPLTIAGEIFPLAYKSLAGGISSLIMSCHLFLAFKITLLCFAKLGVHGTFLIDAILMCHCFVVVWFLLPETKDKMLVEIEDEFRGKPLELTVRPSC